MTEQSVNAIIVGMGGVTKEMLKTLTTAPWYETVGVVDVREEALADARDLLRLPTSATTPALDHALDAFGGNAVIINTPSHLHFPQVKAALESRRHVLVAKPVTNDFDEAVELTTIADRMGVTLAVGQQMRYRRHYRAVARFVASGGIGTPQIVNFINAKPRPKALNLASMLQPALYEMSCHHFDCLLAVFPDASPEWITCDGFRPAWSPYAGPCMVNAAIRFSGNLHILYQGGFSSLADSYEFRIEGTGGALRCRGIHMSRDQMTYEFATPNGAWEPIDIEQHVPAGDAWVDLLEIWRGQIAGVVDPPFSGRNNLLPFALLSAGVESVDTGLPVQLGPHTRFSAAFRG